MAQTINTVIVLRNDQTTNWESSDYKLLKGEVGIGYLDNGNVIAKLGVDGNTAWKDLPQIEGVFEEDLILTYNFGRHTTSNGFVKTTAKGMTTREWLKDALSVTEDPTVTQPTAGITASFTPSAGEVGTPITKVTWTGTFTDGKYEYGSAENSAANSNANTSASAWLITHNGTAVGNTATGSVTTGIPEKITESAVTYKVTADVTINTDDAYTPYNNIGVEVESFKITGFDKAGSKTKSVSSTASVTGYRKPFWGWKDAANALADPEAITSAQVRGLGNGGTSQGGLPTSLTVPKGTKQVYFAAKAGTKSSLVVKNVTKEPATGVACTKVANAVSVEGYDGYTGTNYDLWYINLDAAFTGETKLSLTWA